MEINDEDFETETGCVASHPDRRGGQHVGKQCTGVRITHKPSGASVLCDSERSQHANRVKAWREMVMQLGGVRCVGCGDVRSATCGADDCPVPMQIADDMPD